MSVNEHHAKMDEAYGEFGPKLRVFLESEIERLIDESGLPAVSVLAVTGRALVELGAVDIFSSVTANANTLRKYGHRFAGESVQAIVDAARVIRDSEGV